MARPWQTKLTGWIVIVMLAITAAGCSPASTGSNSNNPNSSGANAGSNNDHAAGGGNVNAPDAEPDPAGDPADKPPVSEDNGESKPDPEQEPAGGSNSGGTPDDQQSDQEAPVPVIENEAFRIFEPAVNATVDGNFVVKGQARVFEAAFSYTFEDGHDVLDEGHVMASMGAPEWGDFEFTVDLSGATNTTGTLTIYEISAKDGSPIHKLTTTVNIDPKLLPKVE